MTLEERFWSRVEQTDSCWLWRGVLNHNGYGRIWLEGNRRAQAHRFAYELLIGPIPTGLQIDHLCRNRACVNPAHLEPVTSRENLLRGETIAASNAHKTHCHAGHLLDEQNTHLRPTGRTCLACRRLRARERYHERKAA